MPFKIIRPLLLICALSTSAWAASIFDIALNVVQGWGRHIEGSPSTRQLTLPQQLTDMPWGLIRIVCEAGGYDLTPYAGDVVSAVTYGIAETWYGEPLSVWVLIKEDTCVCAYITFRLDSSVNAAPGIFAINNPTITYEGQTVTVPTISGWGMIIFIVIAGTGAVYLLRKPTRVG